jgi:hypothetical protein
MEQFAARTGANVELSSTLLNDADGNLGVALSSWAVATASHVGNLFLNLKSDCRAHGGNWARQALVALLP